MEQPAQLLNQMELAQNVYKAVKLFHAPGTRWGEFPEKYPHYWRIILMVRELEKAHNGE